MNAAQVKHVTEFLQSLRPLAGVIAVLILGGAQSVYFVIKKPWCPRVWVRRGQQQVYEHVPPTLEEAAMSSVVSPMVLLAWRLSVLAFITAISIAQYLEFLNFWHLRFYTVWNWNLLGLYFLTSSLATVLYVRSSKGRAAPGVIGGSSTSDASLPHVAAAASQHAGIQATANGGTIGGTSRTQRTVDGVIVKAEAVMGGAEGATKFKKVEEEDGGVEGSSDRRGERGLANAVCVLFHINMTTVAIIDFVTWMVLVPMLTTHNEDHEKAAHYTALFYRFTSYSQHGANAGIMLVELWLNAIPLRTHMVGHVGTWSLIYSVWSFVYYGLTGAWLYPFFDTSKPHAPLAYLGLYLLHWVFFALIWVIFKLKMKLTGKRKLLVNPVKKEA